MKILIIGSCRNDDQEHKILAHRKIAETTGRALAERGHEIITGGAGGLQGILVAAYKAHGGKKWIAYLAKGEGLEKTARPLARLKSDQKIQTGLDYPKRDIFYIAKCDAVIALSGRLLTFAEIIHAVRDYKKKVFQIEIGSNIQLIKNSPELKNKVFISKDINRGLDFLTGK